MPTKLGVFLAFSVFLACQAGQEEGYSRLRQDMVAYQLAGRDISDKKVLEAMGKVPRHLFVSPALRDQAYEDYPLPIGQGQTISQPYIVAFMTQSLEVKPGQKVLEIGTGSGYQAAVLACLTEKVYSIEILCSLAERANALLRQLGYKVEVKCGDGYYGWPEEAPFQAILITSAAERIPEPLLKQLAEGGRLIMPLAGPSLDQVLVLVTKTRGQATLRQLLDVRFVPMTGEVEKRKKGGRLP
ncbi:MAG TPA: protein-L-isoaspartate(D-aspartate) O-methyltransferase [Acidobacteriota bacterium]